MIAYRAFDAEDAFEEARAGRDDAECLVRRAYAAARKGKANEAEACIDVLRRLHPTRAQEVEERVRGIARAVSDHPAGKGQRPG